MSDHHEERGAVRIPVDECFVHLRENLPRLPPDMRIACSALLESLFFKLAVENCALRVLREERARNAKPPKPPAEAFGVKAPRRLPAGMDPHDRPTRPDGVPRLNTGAPARKSPPRGVFDGP